MKYISRDALEQIIDAFIDASQYRLEHDRNRDNRLRCEGEIKAFGVVIKTLDSVAGIESDEEAV